MHHLPMQTSVEIVHILRMLLQMSAQDQDIATCSNHVYTLLLLRAPISALAHDQRVHVLLHASPRRQRSYVQGYAIARTQEGS